MTNIAILRLRGHCAAQSVSGPGTRVSLYSFSLDSVSLTPAVCISLNQENLLSSQYIGGFHQIELQRKEEVVKSSERFLSSLYSVEPCKVKANEWFWNWNNTLMANFLGILHFLDLHCGYWDIFYQYPHGLDIKAIQYHMSLYIIRNSTLYRVFHGIGHQKHCCYEHVLALLRAQRASMSPQDWAQITFRSEMNLNDFNNESGS